MQTDWTNLVARRILAVEIGGTKLQVVVGDAAGRIAQRWRGEVDRSKGGAGICVQIEQAIGELTKDHGVDAVGVGFGGPVDWRRGKVCVSHQVAGWDQFEVGEWLGKLTGQAVAVDNDANVAALGETLSGAGRGARSVFYVTMGSGVGGGLTIDGKIYHGELPGECEFGHVRLDRAGTTVESRCSGWAVDRRIRELERTDPQSVLCRLIGKTPGGEARHLAEALAAGDPAAGRILADLADDLAFGLSHVVHLLHPQRVVLGGGLSFVGEPLRSAVANALRTHIMKAFAPGPDVCLGGLGEDAVPVGAVHLAVRSAQ